MTHHVQTDNYEGEARRDADKFIYKLVPFFWALLAAAMSVGITWGVYRTKLETLSTQNESMQIALNKAITDTSQMNSQLNKANNDLDKRVALVEQAVGTLPNINKSLEKMNDSIQTLTVLVAREIGPRRSSGKDWPVR